jgi:HNH endonuclease
MGHKPLPPLDVVKRRCYYNPTTGELKSYTHKLVKCGGIKINGVMYQVYRIAWLLYYGKDPGHYQIDHIDGDWTNNKISNLRLATNSQNQCNTGVSTQNTSGHKGVTRGNGKWRAIISKNGTRYHLGYFINKDDAVAAYNNASKTLHKEFSRIRKD